MMSIKTHTVKCPIDEPLKKRYTVLEKFYGQDERSSC